MDVPYGLFDGQLAEKVSQGGREETLFGVWRRDVSQFKRREAKTQKKTKKLTRKTKKQNKSNYNKHPLRVLTFHDWNNLDILFTIYQPLRSGRIWHKVNF